MQTDAFVLNISAAELQVIEIWRRKKISIMKAKKNFSVSLENPEFDGIWSLKHEVDRVKFLRYLFTGCIFVEQNSAEGGNPTMFAKINGYIKIPQFESFFKSVNLWSIHLSKPRKNSLYEEICSVTFGKLVLFSNLLFYQWF